jgi:oligoribonuclease
MIPFVDVETTGLQTTGPNPSLLLELGIVVTDDDLNEVAASRWLITPATPLHHVVLDPYVMKMHTANGLFNEIETYGGNPLPFVETAAIAFLTEQSCLMQPMYGSSLRLDRDLIDYWLPTLGRAFHYRLVDVSTLKEFTKKFFPNLALPPTPEEDKAHRVLDDCRASIEELRHYRDAYGGDT